MDWKGVWLLSEQFEPLLIFVCLPYESHIPGHKKRAKLLEEFHRFMLRDKLQKAPEMQRRNFLCKFSKQAWALQRLLGDMVRTVLQVSGPKEIVHPGDKN
jgi:hypothetical protein